jgi:hypothetical protein
MSILPLGTSSKDQSEARPSLFFFFSMSNQHTVLMKGVSMATKQLDRIGEYLTLEAAAHEKGATRWALYKFLQRNQQVPTYRIGTVVFVRLCDLAGFVPRD